MFDPVTTGSTPDFDERQDYLTTFMSPTSATITVTWFWDYHYKQCLVHWYGTPYRP